MDSMTRWQQALEHNPADLSRNELWSVCVSVAMSFQIKDRTYQESSRPGTSGSGLPPRSWAVATTPARARTPT